MTAPADHPPRPLAELIAQIAEVRARLREHPGERWHREQELRAEICRRAALEEDPPLTPCQP